MGELGGRDDSIGFGGGEGGTDEDAVEGGHENCEEVEGVCFCVGGIRFYLILCEDLRVSAITSLIKVEGEMRECNMGERDVYVVYWCD